MDRTALFKATTETKVLVFVWVDSFVFLVDFSKTVGKNAKQVGVRAASGDARVASRADVGRLSKRDWKGFIQHFGCYFDRLYQ